MKYSLPCVLVFALSLTAGACKRRTFSDSTVESGTSTSNNAVLSCDVADGWQLRLTQTNESLIFNYSKFMGDIKAEHSFSLKRNRKDSKDNDTHLIYGAEGSALPAGGPGPVVMTSDNDVKRSMQLFEFISSLPLTGVEVNGRLDSSMKIVSAVVNVLHQQAGTERYTNAYLTCQKTPVEFNGQKVLASNPMPDVKSVHTLRSGLYKTYAGAGTEIEFGPVAGAGVDLTIKGMNHEKITLGSSNGTNWLFEGKGCTIKADVISSSMVQVTQEGPCEYYGFPQPDKFNLSGAFVLKPTPSVQKL